MLDDWSDEPSDGFFDVKPAPEDDYPDEWADRMDALEEMDSTVAAGRCGDDHAWRLFLDTSGCLDVPAVKDWALNNITHS